MYRLHSTLKMPPLEMAAPAATESAPTDLKSLRVPSIARTLLALAVDYGLIVGSIAAVLATNFNPLVFLAALIVIGRTQHSMMLLGHEAIHVLLTKNKALNDFMGAYMTFAWVGIGFRRARNSHWDHHRYFGSEYDEEIQAVTPARGGRLGFITHFAGPLFFGALLGKLPFFKSPRAHIVRQPISTQARIYDLISIVVCQSLLIGASLAIDWRIYPLLWVLPLLTFGALAHRVKAFCDHASLTGDKTTILNVFEPDWWDYLVVGMEQKDHGLHHHFAMIPYYNLAVLRERNIVDPDAEPIVPRRGYVRFVLACFSHVPRKQNQHHSNNT